MSKETTESAGRDQRPFHICPECNAYNAKFNARCWRCEHDMSVNPITPSGVLGYRLEELDRGKEKREG